MIICRRESSAQILVVFFLKDGRTAGEENDEASDGAFLTKNRKYYRRLFIFEPVEAAQNTRSLLNNSSSQQQQKSSSFSLSISPPLSLSLSHSKMSVWSFSSDEEGV